MVAQFKLKQTRSKDDDLKKTIPNIGNGIEKEMAELFMFCTMFSAHCETMVS